MISRRALITGGAAAAAAVLGTRRVWAQTRTTRLAIHTAQKIGTIRPELHGHFAEHLGNCTYNGLWVGPHSSVPNINGYRKQAVEYLKQLGIPVLRWPGGCFADDYHWRDGIGPAAKRPKRVNIWWGQYVEDNSFGTHEFIGLCKLIGAEPYLAGNVGSGTPDELRNWMEYCNYPSGSTLSDERAANGSKEPFGVKYWGVGNENWGCGGNLTSPEYAALYKRYATYLRPRGGIGDTKGFLIACGANRNDGNWTRGFFETLGNNKIHMVDGFAMHFYSNGRARATEFDADNLRAQMASFAELEKSILQQHSMLRGYDPTGRIGFMVDEWGVWDRIPPADEQKNGKLWQQITIRGAVAAAMGLNVFHRQADKLYMCNIAQIANVLHSMILTEGDKTLRTPAYWAFDLEKPHRGKTAVGIEQDANDRSGVSVSASRGDKTLVLTFANPTHDEPRQLQCDVVGASVGAATARILHNRDMNAYNSFDKPDALIPVKHAVERGGSKLSVAVPPLSVVTVEAQLA